MRKNEIHLLNHVDNYLQWRNEGWRRTLRQRLIQIFRVLLIFFFWFFHFRYLAGGLGGGRGVLSLVCRHLLRKEKGQ